MSKPVNVETCQFLVQKRQGSGAQGHFELLAPIISVEWMQLQSSIFVHKCTAGGYLCQIKKICQNATGVTEYNSL